MEQIEHFCHQHPLKFSKISRGDVPDRKVKSCPGCSRYLVGEIYSCTECDFELHKACLELLPREMQHRNHPQHPLTLLPNPPYPTPSFKCNSCKINQKGPAFHCVECQFDLHLHCALNGMIITHFSHQHPLISFFIESMGKESYCFGCGVYLRGPAYWCPKCDICFHKSCAEIQAEMQHQFHPQHPLTLLDNHNPAYHRTTSFKCNSCEGEEGGKGFIFHCAECHFDLHIHCALAKDMLTHEAHQHPLRLFDEGPLFFLPGFYEPPWRKGFRCDACGYGNPDDIFNGTGISVYHCVGCKYGLHSECASLPRVLKHKCHIHPLTLTFTFPDDDDSDDFYCDVCEDKTDPKLWVYYCAECNFFAELSCVTAIPKRTQGKAKK